MRKIKKLIKNIKVLYHKSNKIKQVKLKKKLVFLTKGDIDTLPEYRGYIQKKLFCQYNVYFISEHENHFIKINKEYFGISIVLPKEKSRFKFYIKVFFILSKLKPDLVHLFWFTSAFIIPILSRVTLKKYIVMGDFRTKSTATGFKGRKKDIVLRFESLFFHKRITLDERLAQYLFNNKADCYIPMGYNQEIFYDHNVEKKYDFIYAGSISKDRGVFNFIKEFNKITGCRFKILIIGWGEDADKIESLSNNFSNIFYLPKVSREEIPKFYSESRVGISYVDRSGMLDIQQPTKILEYIACGNSILVNASVGTLELTDKLMFEGIIFNQISELKDLDINDFISYKGLYISEYSWYSIIKNRLMPFYESILIQDVEKVNKS